MSIVERLKRWRELVRLRSRARRSPSPSAWGDLAERLVACGRVDAALQAADEGLRAFPHSERLAQVRLFAKRSRLAGELRRLRDDVARRPTPAAYGQLAALYRDLEQSDEALEVAREGADRFPLSEACHLLQGEIRLERFLRDRVSRDAVLAEQALQRALRINPRNAAAAALLAELCWAVGDRTACRLHLAVALESPDAAAALHEFARELDAAAPDAGTDDEAGFAELAMLVEERRAFANAPERFPTARRASSSSALPACADAELLGAEIERVGAAPHVRGAVALGSDGGVLAVHVAPDRDHDETFCRTQLADLVASVATAADDAMRRLDAGALVRAEVECPAGRVLVARMRGVTLGLLYGAPLDADAAWELVQDAVARCVPAGEAARA